MKHNLEVAKKIMEAPYPREDEFQRLKARSEEIEGDVHRSHILKLVGDKTETAQLAIAR